MTLTTRLTERFGIEHPIISAPMGFLAGGALAAAVTRAGGLGLIGGGYGDRDWLEREFSAAGNERVGCGFIAWSLANTPGLLDRVLARKPAALMLSFGPLASLAPRVKEADVPLICQVQSMAHAREAVDSGAEVIVAQGAEAGGHSGSRSTLTLVPEVADLLAGAAPDTILVAAGGIADGRGLAAALMLGADGVLIGSRLLAAHESLAPEGFKTAILGANGDATLKTSVVDIVRGFDWPNGFSVRVIKNRWIAGWHGREQELSKSEVKSVENARYWTAFRSGDAENAGVMVSEAAGLIREVGSAKAILDDMVAEASRLLGEGPRHLASAGGAKR